MKLSVLVLCSFLITSGLTKDAAKKVDSKKSGKREIPSKSYLPPQSGGNGGPGGFNSHFSSSGGLGPYGAHGPSFSSHGGSFGSSFLGGQRGSFGGGQVGSFGGGHGAVSLIGGHGGSFGGPQSSGFGGSFVGFGGPKGGHAVSFANQGPTVETYIIASGPRPGGKGGFSTGRHGGFGSGLKLGGGYAGNYGGGSFGGGQVTLKTIAIPATFASSIVGGSGLGHGGPINGPSFGGGKFESFDIGYAPQGFGGQGLEGHGLAGGFSRGHGGGNFAGGHGFGNGVSFAALGGGHNGIGASNFGGDFGQSGLGGGHGIGLIAVGHGDAGLAGLEGAGLFSGGYRYGAPSNFGSSGHANFGSQAFGGGHASGNTAAPSGSYGVPQSPPLSSYAPTVSVQQAVYEGDAGLDASGGQGNVHEGNGQAVGPAGISPGYETPGYATGQKSLRHYSSLSDARYNVVESKPLAVTPATTLHTSFSSSSPTSGSTIHSTAGPSKAPFRPSIFLGATHEANDGSNGHYTNQAQEFSSGSTGYASPTPQYAAQSLGAVEHSYGNIEQSFNNQQNSYNVPQASYVVAEQHQAYVAPAARGQSGLTLGTASSYPATGFEGSHQHGAGGSSTLGSYLQQVTKPGRDYLPPSGSHH